MKIHLSLLLLFCTSITYSQNPIADFQVNIEYKCGYATTEFVNNSVYASTFLWDIDGTGNFIETFEPAGSNIGIDKKWTVTLIARQDELSDTLSKELEIFNTKVKFETDQAEAGDYAPLTISFINSSEIRKDEVISYLWDFGDGTQSNEESPEHTYDLPDTYFVTLTGMNTDACELSYTDYIIVKDTAQEGEFEFIKSDCIFEYETPPCGYDKHYSLVDDILVVYGFYYGNCGTQKTATIRANGDSIKIKTWEVGPLTTCSCGYCFEIVIPDIAQDSVIVIFNGETLSTVSDNIPSHENGNSGMRIFPNPANDFITINTEDIDLKNCEFKIIDIDGRILKTGILGENNQVDLGNIEKGFYLLSIWDQRNSEEYIKGFIKN